LADSAYGTGDALAALAAAGHRPVIKPWPLQAAAPGGFTLDDFVIDEQAGSASCPNGVTRPITPRAYAEARRAEGKTDREIRRCLKRYIARRLFRQLENPPKSATRAA
jgi:hypothetical protein